MCTHVEQQMGKAFTAQHEQVRLVSDSSFGKFQSVAQLYIRVLWSSAMFFG